MRKILQNRTGVGWLVVVAAVCVAGNFIHLPNHQPLTASGRENATAPEEVFNAPPASRVADELRNWRETFPLETLSRDPFAATIEPPPAAVTNLGPTLPTFQLQAVSLADGKALAVINRRVVAEGEMIEGCRVERILPREVRLVSPFFGLITATFDRTPNHNKPASANPPAADLPAGPAAATQGKTAR